MKSVVIVLSLIVVLNSCKKEQESVKATNVSFPSEFKYIGRITFDTVSSPPTKWSIGAETLDRRYVSYDDYKVYLDALGVGKIRLQGGWARCERKKGVYDFRWLDTLVNDAISRGLKPWLQFSYGNSVYGPGGDFPDAENVLPGWLNWVKATTEHFKDRVNEWEIWNEPYHQTTGKRYAKFYVATAEIVKDAQPSSKILGIVSSPYQEEFIVDFLAYLSHLNKLSLIDIATFHPYSANPDQDSWQLDNVKKIIARYSTNIEVMDGETGCPSTAGSYGALSELTWTELSQSKWVLRRLLGDRARYIKTSLFTISNINYPKGVNTKGLIANFIPSENNTKIKRTYTVVSNIFKLFNDNILASNNDIVNFSADDYSCYAYYNQLNNQSYVTLWNSKNKPSENTTSYSLLTVSIKRKFTDPIFVNLLTGEAFSMPANSWNTNANGTSEFGTIPVPDYPVMIIDRSAIELI